MELVESLCLEVLKGHVDVALRHVLRGHGGDGLMVGLDDLRGLFQLSWFREVGRVSQYTGEHLTACGTNVFAWKHPGASLGWKNRVRMFGGEEVLRKVLGTSTS